MRMKTRGLEYFGAILLMALASLRFCDAKDVQRLWKRKTAICGISINHKDSGGALMSWATPRCGLESEGKWLSVIDQQRAKQKVKFVGEFAPLFPMVTPAWVIDRRCPGTSGTVQSALTRIERRLGFTPLCTLHSPRNWFPTLGGAALNFR